MDFVFCFVLFSQFFFFFIFCREYLAHSNFDFRRLGWFAPGLASVVTRDYGYRTYTMKPPFKGPNKIKKKVFFAL